MKRAFALSFLLLSNIIILAHAVVPHHYHSQIPDISWNSLHKNDNKCTDPNCPVHQITDECFLKKIGVRFDNNGQLKSTIEADCKLVPCLMPLFSPHPLTEISCVESLPFTQKPYFISHYTDFTSLSLGLRAPPAIMN